MNKSPFISILTASLNSESTLKKTLESIRSQSFQDLEHIVVDGGSRDETPMILEESEKDYNLTWISEPDNGIAHALNKGLRLARGRYILVIQADDCLLNEQTLAGVFNRLQYDFDIHCFSVIFENSVGDKRLGKHITLLWWHRFRNIFSHQGVFVHRRVFDRIGKFNENFSISMDYDFFYRALKDGCTVKFEKTPVALMGGTGISADTVMRLKDEFRVQKFNENNPFWRVAQTIFKTLYFPYKISLLPKLRKHFRKEHLLIDADDL